VEPTDYNRRAWDEIHRRRADAMADQLGIPETIRERLPDVKGKHVLHLQCATGESTAELAELGALVTAVDISAEATAVARERVPNAVFLEADVQQLPLQLERGRFDLVYTGGGIFHWLHDLDAWAGGIASALRPGGLLLAYSTRARSSKSAGGTSTCPVSRRRSRSTSASGGSARSSPPSRAPDS